MWCVVRLTRMSRSPARGAPEPCPGAGMGAGAAERGAFRYSVICTAEERRSGAGATPRTVPYSRYRLLRVCSDFVRFHSHVRSYVQDIAGSRFGSPSTSLKFHTAASTASKAASTSRSA